MSSNTNKSRGVWIFVLANFVLPLVIYAVCSPYMSDVAALSLSGIPPALQTLRQAIVHKVLDPLAALVLVSIAASVVLANLTADARLLLVKDSFLTLVTGAAFLGSLCCARENLIWIYNRQFAGPDAQADLDAKGAVPEVQRTTRLMCLVWGCGLVAESLLRVVLVYSVPIATMAYLSTIIMLTTVLALAAWSYLYTRHRASLAAQAMVTVQPDSCHVAIATPADVV